jgi:hypothetical protein
MNKLIAISLLVWILGFSGIKNSTTYADVVLFLSTDETNSIEYSFDYNCLNYSIDLVNNAKKESMNASIVIVFLEDGERHSFVSFETIDRGVVYVEPQNDGFFTSIKIGDKLCDTVWGCIEGGVISNYFLNQHCTKLFGCIGVFTK